MDVANRVLTLKNAHVIDPAQGIDRVCDVTLADGKIAAVGAAAPVAGAEVLDLAGHYLTPGWIDMHVHAYGTLGFGDPDNIGIRQGVTTFVDAGGTGIDSLDEFVELMADRLVTETYAGPIVQAFGIIGTDEKGRALTSIPVHRWIEWHAQHPGTIRYVKSAAYGIETSGLISLSKGIAKILNLPLYVHIGEIQPNPRFPSTVEDVFKICEAGDIITHIYHNNPGKVLDANGKVLPFVWDAQRRGVLFDIGYGGYNFAWEVAEKGIAQGLLPDFISSDLQQFNVLNPVHSLANCMSAFLKLGLPLNDVIADVTSKPADALSLSDRAGSLRVGQPADITVFRMEDGAFEIWDCYKQKRVAERQIVPVMAFKRGVRVDSDLLLAEDERNWFMQISEDEIPPAVDNLSAAQIEFLGSLANGLSTVEWGLYRLEGVNHDRVYEIYDVFHNVRRAHGLSLKDAATAVFDSFLVNPFTMQLGIFLIRMERPFVLDRLRAVAGRRSMAA